MARQDAVLGPTTEKEQERFIMSASAKANKESSYYVDPNTHVKPEAGPQEPVDPGRAGDKMIGKDTGGQDHFKSHGMRSD
jgi:hypothetical protein